MDGEESFTPVFEVHSKALYEEQETAFFMLREMLMTSKTDDAKRLREIIAETKSRLQMAFQTSGHSMAALRAMSYFSGSAEFSDMTGGVDFYRFIEELDASLKRSSRRFLKSFQSLWTSCSGRRIWS